MIGEAVFALRYAVQVPLRMLGQEFSRRFAVHMTLCMIGEYMWRFTVHCAMW